MNIFHNVAVSVWPYHELLALFFSAALLIYIPISGTLHSFVIVKCNLSIINAPIFHLITTPLNTSLSHNSFYFISLPSFSQYPPFSIPRPLSLSRSRSSSLFFPTSPHLFLLHLLILPLLSLSLLLPTLVFHHPYHTLPFFPSLPLSPDALLDEGGSWCTPAHHHQLVTHPFSEQDRQTHGWH